MILRLMRHDPVVSYLRVGVPAYFLAGLFAGTVARQLPAGFGIAPLASSRGIVLSLYVCVWLFANFALVPTSFWVRSSTLLVSLPISMRRVWLARILSMASGVFLPLEAMSIGLALSAGATWNGFLPDPRILGVGAHLSVATVLPVVLAHLWTPRLYAIRLRAEFILFCIISALATLIISIVTVPMSLATLLMGAGTVLAGLRVYRSLPESFVIADSTPVGEDDPDRVTSAPRSGTVEAPGNDAIAASTAPATRWNRLVFHHWTIARTLISQWGIWIVLPIVILYATVITLELHEGGLPLLGVIFVVIWFWVALLLGTSKMYLFDPLPVRRRVIYIHTIVPGVLAVLIGIGIGNTMLVVKKSPPRLIGFRQCCLQIPYEYHEITRDGRPPDVVSPWGERFQPRGHRLYAGSDIVVYNPFEHGIDSSVRFVGYQIDRAARALHGNSGGRVFARIEGSGGEKICDALRHDALAIDPSVSRIPPRRSKLFALVLACGYVLGCIGVAFALLARDRKPRGWRFGVVPVAMIGAIAAFLIMLAVLEGRGQLELWVIGAYIGIMLGRAAEAIPFGVTTVWLLFLIVILAGQLFVLWRFQKCEAPTKRMTKQFIKEF